MGAKETDRSLIDPEREAVAQAIESYKAHSGVLRRMAEAVKVSPATISNYRKKKRVPGLLICKRIAVFLGKTLPNLLTPESDLGTGADQSRTTEDVAHFPFAGTIRAPGVAELLTKPALVFADSASNNGFRRPLPIPQELLRQRMGHEKKPWRTSRWVSFLVADDVSERFRQNVTVFVERDVKPREIDNGDVVLVWSRELEKDSGQTLGLRRWIAGEHPVLLHLTNPRETPIVQDGTTALYGVVRATIG